MIQRDRYLGRIRPASRSNGKRLPGRVERVLLPMLVVGSVLAAMAGMYYLVTSKQLLAVQRVVVLGARWVGPGRGVGPNPY